MELWVSIFNHTQQHSEWVLMQHSSIPIIFLPMIKPHKFIEQCMQDFYSNHQQFTHHQEQSTQHETKFTNSRILTII